MSDHGTRSDDRVIGDIEAREHDRVCTDRASDSNSHSTGQHCSWTDVGMFRDRAIVLDDRSRV